MFAFAYAEDYYLGSRGGESLESANLKLRQVMPKFKAISEVKAMLYICVDTALG